MMRFIVEEKPISCKFLEPRVFHFRDAKRHLLKLTFGRERCRMKS